MRALAIGLALLGATPAMARTPRFTRVEPAVRVTLSDRVRPLPPPPAIAVAPAIGLADRDALFGMPIGTPDPQLLAKLDPIAIDQLTPDERPRVLFDRASEHARQSRAARASAVALQLAADREPDARRKQQLLTDSTRAANTAKVHLLRAVKDFKGLTENDAYLQFAELDTALFRYGYLLQSGMYMKEARSAYDRLLKYFPNSKYVPTAHLVFGEYYFEANQLADAEARYKMVLKFPRSDVYAYALYKMGWVNFRLQRFQESLEAFFQVAIQSKTPQLEPLARASRLDFVRAYAEIGKADKAYPAFQRVDRGAAFDMLERLGELYGEQGKADKAIYISQELIKLAPTDARVCGWQYRVARNTLSMPGASTADKVTAATELARLDAALEAKGVLPAPAAQECRANAVAMTAELGRAFHDEAQKTRNTTTFDYAIALYQAYVDSFPTDSARAEIHVLLAEALWSRASSELADRVQRELFERAGAAFTAAAKLDRVNPREDARAAAYAWLNALDDKLVAFTVPVQLSPNVAPPPATQLAPREAEAFAAFDAYGVAINDVRDPDLGVMRFAQARMLSAARQHAQAAGIYVALTTTHPTAPFAEAAAVHAIDAMVLAQQLDALLAFADKLNADPNFLAGKPDLARIVKLVRSRSMRR